MEYRIDTEEVKAVIRVSESMPWDPAPPFGVRIRVYDPAGAEVADKGAFGYIDLRSDMEEAKKMNRLKSLLAYYVDRVMEEVMPDDFRGTVSSDVATRP